MDRPASEGQGSDGLPGKVRQDAAAVRSGCPRRTVLQAAQETGAPRRLAGGRGRPPGPRLLATPGVLACSQRSSDGPGSLTLCTRVRPPFRGAPQEFATCGILAVGVGRRPRVCGPGSAWGRESPHVEKRSRWGGALERVGEGLRLVSRNESPVCTAEGEPETALFHN